jgi:hypothetical protein
LFLQVLLQFFWRKLLLNASKLTDDLKAANEAASLFVAGIDDRGTANLDKVILRIPGVQEATVLEAIKQAGLHCRGRRKWIGEGYMITPTSAGQAQKRSQGVSTMVNQMRDLGWEALQYCQND